jgi:hypothetical protein
MDYLNNVGQHRVTFYSDSIMSSNEHILNKLACCVLAVVILFY